jgi:Uncharacterized protein conserved in bacteria (DUF2188)
MADGFVHAINGRGEWVVQVEGSSRVRSRHTTPAELFAAGRGIARKAKTEPLVRGRDGAIRDRSSHGRDRRHRPG